MCAALCSHRVIKFAGEAIHTRPHGWRYRTVAASRPAAEKNLYLNLDKTFWPKAKCQLLTAKKERPGALSPSHRASLVRSLTYVLTGATELYLDFVGSPPALSPSLAGSLRTGNREAADSVRT